MPNETMPGNGKINIAAYIVEIQIHFKDILRTKFHFSQTILWIYISIYSSQIWFFKFLSLHISDIFVSLNDFLNSMSLLAFIGKAIY